MTLNHIQLISGEKQNKKQSTTTASRLCAKAEKDALMALGNDTKMGTCL